MENAERGATLDNSQTTKTNKATTVKQRKQTKQQQ
jgi:hypothetical protein